MSRKSGALAAILALAAISQAAESPAPAPPLAAGQTDPAVGSDYIIGPGDMVQVFVLENPDLTITVPVLPDGKISTPMVQGMMAAGKTSGALAADIEQALVKYYRTPQVSVIVTQAVSALSQVKVMGEVLRPQALPFREGMTVLDALLAVGGLDEFAAGNRSKLIRTQNGKQVEIRVRLGRLFDGDMKENHPLRPGDVLLVPESRW